MSDMNSLNICVVGDAKVGKTALVQNWFKENDIKVKYDGLKHVHAKLEGYNFEFCECHDLLESNEWVDILKHSDFIFIVYSVTNKRSFEHAKRDYLRIIRKHGSPIVNLMMVGTHSDNESKRVIPIKEAERVASRQSLFFMELSNKDMTNVDLTLRLLLIRIPHYFKKLNLWKSRNGQAPGPSTEDSSSQPDTQQIEEELDYEPQGIQSDMMHSPNPLFQHQSGYNSGTSTPQQIYDDPPTPTPQPVSPQSSSTKKANHENTDISIHLSPDKLQSTYKIHTPKQSRYISSSGDITFHDDETSYDGSPESRFDKLAASREARSRQYNHSRDMIKSFHKTRDGYTVPVITTNLKSDNFNEASNVLYSKRTKKKSKPKIHLDINIGDGRVGQIAIGNGDNVYELAEEFVKAFKLDGSYIHYLAYMIRNAINKHVKRSKKRKQASLRQDAKFELETMKRATQPRLSPPIVKIDIDIGAGKRGTIVVRKDDNPYALAKNFVLRHGQPNKKSLIDGIAKKIQQQLYTYYATQAKSALKDLPRKLPTTSFQLGYLDDEEETFFNDLPTKKHVLFNMEVEIAKGVQHVIQVIEGKTPEQLATAFVKEHKLNKKAKTTLVDLITHHLNIYLKKQ